MNGRQIRIYLVDGQASGILTAEIMNWTGKVIVSPRSQLASMGQREEVQKTGIYVLVGPDPVLPHRDRIYVGEGDNVFERLKSHEKDNTKDFWTRVVCVISKDENITKSHGRYLESRLISLSWNSGRASVTNGTAPQVNPLPEADIADMEHFLEQIQLVFPVLGFTFLVPKASFDPTDQKSAKSPPRFIMSDVGTEATAIEIRNEFVVLKGSTARKTGSRSWDSYIDLRDDLVTAKKLVDGPNPEYYVFAEDVPFDSPSAAAAVVAAGNRNGRTTWRLATTNQTYAEWQASKLAGPAFDQ